MISNINIEKCIEIDFLTDENCYKNFIECMQPVQQNNIFLIFPLEFSCLNDKL